MKSGTPAVCGEVLFNPEYCRSQIKMIGYILCNTYRLNFLAQNYFIFIKDKSLKCLLATVDEYEILFMV